MPPEPVWPRLWAKVDKRGQDECWPWTARGADRRGYPLISLNGFPRRVGRIIVADKESIDLHGDWVARHSCDNPPCCNPAHLSSGTTADNHADMVSRGRSTVGEKHGMAKLTDQQVAAVRARRASGERVVDLAAAFGLHPESVTRIVNGRSR